ncbi:DUF2934 domain-containing protein, partial [Mesorhizobium sp.]|uniref:DUF2934 domain-containing protein n=1 Tax=Mesorhizobium sp. TaxID=1871066 RepID=UPI00338F4FF0
MTAARSKVINERSGGRVPSWYRSRAAHEDFLQATSRIAASQNAAGTVLRKPVFRSLFCPKSACRVGSFRSPTRWRNATGGTNMSDEKHERIRRRAYEIWEREGHTHGLHERHWNQAILEIETEDRLLGA